MSARAQFMGGARALVPVLAGVFPFALAAGAFTVSVIKSQSLAAVMTGLMYAGRAQMVAIDLVRQGAPIAIALIACLVVNLRNLMYGASMARYIGHLGWRWRLFLAFMMVDWPYAISIRHIQKQHGTPDAATSHWYLVGAGGTIWLVWTIGGLLGALFGNLIPPTWGLDFVPNLAFTLAIVINLTDRASWTAALAAGAVAVAFSGLQWQLGLFIGAATGLFAGLMVENAALARSEGRPR